MKKTEAYIIDELKHYHIILLIRSFYNFHAPDKKCINISCHSLKKARSRKSYIIPECHRAAKESFLIQHVENKGLCNLCAQFAVFNLDRG